MSPTLEKLSSNRVSTGYITKYTFPSTSLSLPTKFNVFIPSSASPSCPVPVLFYLAGLECTEDTAAQKGGFLNVAGEEGIAIVFPDTSPRGAGVEGEDDDWQLGTGAGFYINATLDKWSKHYNMYDLVTKEIPSVLKAANLGLDFSRWSLFGHSMGGHGALSIYLKSPTTFKSVSAFAPICNPTKAPWGINAFTNYLSSPPPTSSSSPTPEEWLSHDSTHLLSTSKADKGSLHILIDVGTGDKFYQNGQLRPEEFREAAKKRGADGEVDIRMQDGFDHSYYFVSTFASEHVKWHSKFLKA